MGLPSGRRDAAALLALRLVSNELASRTRAVAESERWRRQNRAERRRQRLVKLGAVAVAVGLAGLVVAKVRANRRARVLEYEPEPVTPEPVTPEPVQPIDEPVPAA
jgi:hypothetical protein